jgi:radical SAM enzyme (TIGR01210 family)
MNNLPKKHLPVARDRKPDMRYLAAGQRRWWDVKEGRFVRADTIYVPYGCPDWGESQKPDGMLTRNDRCTFCALPNAVQAYRDLYYAGQPIPDEELVRLLVGSLQIEFENCYDAHTLMIFDGGSFLALPEELQRRMLGAVPLYEVKHVVLEARAQLITAERVRLLSEILNQNRMRFTVRIGVETRDARLRNHVLKKGHGERQLHQAVELLHAAGAQVGGYALLNPAPGLEPEWAEKEAVDTVRWILNPAPEGLGMDEVYFGPTCVGPSTLLESAWRAGLFKPASLKRTHRVLGAILTEVGQGKVHLLPFRDEPPFLSIPSNHNPQGLPESLEGAQGCDHAYHELFDRYRESMDPDVLKDAPVCPCDPTW